MDVWNACRSGDVNSVLNALQYRDARYWSPESLKHIVRAQLLFPETWPNLSLLRRIATELGPRSGALLDAFLEVTDNAADFGPPQESGRDIMRFFVDRFGHGSVLRQVAGQQAWFALAAMPEPVDRLGVLLEHAVLRVGAELYPYTFGWGKHFASETSDDRLRQYAQAYARDPFVTPFSRLTREALLRDALETRRGRALQEARGLRRGLAHPRPGV